MIIQLCNRINHQYVNSQSDSLESELQMKNQLRVIQDLLCADNIKN